jgi:prepilin-type N-terminal cleavage/methylation domain-containing protein
MRRHPLPGNPREPRDLRRAPRPRSAFTLIELLVVITLITLLLAMLLPAFSGAMEQSNRAVCASNLHQLNNVLVSYSSDNYGTFPSHVSQFIDSIHDGNDWSRPVLKETLLGYAASVWVYYCPSSSAPDRLPPDSRTFWSWNNDPGGGTNYESIDYMLLAGLENRTDVWYTDTTGVTPYPVPLRTTDATTGRNVMAADFNDSWPAGGYGSPTRPARFNHANGKPDMPGSNLLYVDGSAGWRNGPPQAQVVRNHSTPVYTLYHFW